MARPTYPGKLEEDAKESKDSGKTDKDRRLLRLGKFLLTLLCFGLLSREPPLVRMYTYKSSRAGRVKVIRS